jgi:hypothetical protein
MYFEGKIGIELAGTTLQLRPPSNFFGGVANLMTKGRWATREEHETYKLMALAQSVFRLLADRGIDNVVRVTIGPTVVYEDLEGKPHDLEAATQRLQEMIDLGHLELGPDQEFDMLLRFDDGTLNAQVDFDFRRDHPVGELPAMLRVRAIPSELRREPMETDDQYRARIAPYFGDQEAFDAFRNRLEEQFRHFLAELAAGIRERLNAVNVAVDVELKLVRRRDLLGGELDTGWGTPFYGYDPTWDLAYFWLLDDLMFAGGLHPYNFVYVDPWGSPLAYVGADGWSGGDFDRFDQSDSGGGGFLSADTSGSDSGGGGWLSNVGDMFSGSDSGGGGDVGGDSGGGSSCGSCGGGGGCNS